MLRTTSALVLLLAATLACAQTPGVIESRRAKQDFQLTADSASKHWKGVKGVLVTRNYLGEPIPGPPTEIRSRWTLNNLYLLYICPYEQLNLKPEPVLDADTPRLWNWDVGEAFIGSDFQHITKYKELQVSPQGEWIDLDIDRENPKGQQGARWNSGYRVKGRIDEVKKVWYGEMCIPMDKIGISDPRPGLELRAGLYRIAGVAPNRKYYAWQPTGQTTFHVPEKFGRLRLVK